MNLLTLLYDLPTPAYDDSMISRSLFCSKKALVAKFSLIFSRVNGPLLNLQPHFHPTTYRRLERRGSCWQVRSSTRVDLIEISKQKKDQLNIIPLSAFRQLSLGFIHYLSIEDRLSAPDSECLSHIVLQPDSLPNLFGLRNGLYS